ncbi:MAG: Na+/H+ antiporter [Rhodomicrobium sp.]
MTATLHTALLLLAVLVVVAVLARKLNIAPSILLVIAGAGLALVPQLPRVELAPEFFLLGVLPPIIYSAGVQMSWREFRFNLRPIALLAVGCVIFTACAVAGAAYWFLGLPLAAAFVLGAIVAPPDAVAPLAIARQLGLPRRLVVVLEGEGLANDATALILYRFAVVAASTGVFSLPQAAGTFCLILVGEIAYGIGIGWLSLRLRRWAKDPRVEITLSLMTPYAAFWLPAYLGGSGVLATVAAGLFVSWNGPLLIPAATRLQGIFFWDLLVYLLEGLIFLVMGLQARTVIERMHAFTPESMAFAVLLVVAVAVAARFIWVFPAIYVPRWLSSALARRDPSPPWTWAFFLGFAGVRGAVSLAAALGLPTTVADGTPFPGRDIILFVTFGVIVITLVGQGMSLPLLVRWLGLDSTSSAERRQEREAEHKARVEALEVAQRRLDELTGSKPLPDDLLSALRTRQDYRSSRLQHKGHIRGDSSGLGLASRIRSDLFETERRFIFDLLRQGRITDESRRRMERELDLEEASAAGHAKGGIEPPL